MSFFCTCVDSCRPAEGFNLVTLLLRLLSFIFHRQNFSGRRGMGHKSLSCTASSLLLVAFMCVSGKDLERCTAIFRSPGGSSRTHEVRRVNFKLLRSSPYCLTWCLLRNIFPRLFTALGAPEEKFTTF